MWPIVFTVDCVVLNRVGFQRRWVLKMVNVKIVIREIKPLGQLEIKGVCIEAVANRNTLLAIERNKADAPFFEGIGDWHFPREDWSRKNEAAKEANQGSSAHAALQEE
jgi:hypothetical protein